MAYCTVNPATNTPVKSFPSLSSAAAQAAAAAAQAAQPAWAARPWAERAALLRNAGQVLRQRRDDLARLITLEMGKLLRESRAEVEKSAWVCEFYADEAERMLADELVTSDAGRSFVAHLPLGVVLGVMPWNFPFWQVFRYAAPALMAGNTSVLKHASNVPQCALAIAEVFVAAGIPPEVFQTLLVDAGDIADLIASPAIAAVTLTGSEPAGRKVAAAAGAHLKKSVLELGGSDAVVVLADADLELAAATGVAGRYANCGQSCISAKRFILVPEIADSFLAMFCDHASRLRCGDPLDDNTSLAPMARPDLRAELHQQVTDSLAQGAVARLGCSIPEGDGAFYPASVLDQVTPACRAYHEELFGPVAIIIRARDEADALRIANDSRFGLGGSIWTQDLARGEKLARDMQSGTTFVNGLVKSDPRLPFGGIKASGYGRELSYHGIREFVNIKTVWIR